MDRRSIQRSDFPTARRGYQPDAVDAHLREVADAVESLRGRGGQPVAAAASSRVQQILEAAESTADQLRADAGDVVEIAPPAGDEDLLEDPPPRPDPVGEEPVVEVEEPVAAEPEPVAEGARETRAAKARAKRGAKAEAAPQPAAAESDDVEAARLVALDMALGGTPRDETERYLAEHYTLADPAAVLDDVYALAGS